MTSSIKVTHPYILERLRNNEISFRTAQYHQEILKRLTTYARDELGLNITVMDVENLTEEQVKDYLVSLQMPNTHNVNMRFLKMFYAAHGKTYLAQYKKRKVDMEAPKYDQRAIDAIIAACRNDRDRVLMGTFLETGDRIGEIASVTLGDIEEDPKTKGLKIHCQKSKTKKRGVGIIDNAALIRRWKNKDHPHAGDPTAPLLCTISDNTGVPIGSPMDEDSIYEAFRRLRVRAIRTAQKANDLVLVREIKRIHPHSCRHIATTNDVKAKIPEALIKVRRGWKPNSTMIARYTHVDEEDADAAYAESKGIQLQEVTPMQPPHACPNCTTLNPAAAQFCNSCGAAMNATAGKQIEAKQDAIEHKIQLLVEKLVAEKLKDLHK